jgi:omega-6 fatty acid desaturase (delta-12 desaturase)
VPVLRIKQQKQALISRYARPEDLRGLVESFTTFLPIALLWWLAAWSWRGQPWLVPALILVLAFFMMRVFVLMHECGHGSLFRSLWLNRAFGFVFGVVAGMPQYVWSKHHNFHHANNGNWERFRGPLTTPSVEEYAAWSRSRQRRYRFVRHIAMAPLGGFVYLIFNPRYTWCRGSLGMLRHACRRKIAQPAVSLRLHAASYRCRYWQSAREYRHMLWNNLAWLGMVVSMCWLLGTLPFLLIYSVSVSLAGGAGIALFTVQHNFEHSYASDSAHWDYDIGAIKGTSFLVMPAWLNWFTANIAYHHVHHLSSRIPSYRLAAAHNDNRDMFEVITRVRLSQVPASLKCLLWDQQAQRIISFAEYHRQYALAH